MKILLTSLCILLSVSMYAQFSGYYAPSNWTAANDPACGNGYTDASGAPAAVTVVGSEGACAGVSSYTIAVQLCGTLSFDWNFTTTDCQGPYWDPFGYSINGVATQLTDNGGANNQSGTVSIAVTGGDVFSFYVYSRDAFCGVAWSTVSNFSAPDYVCYGDDGEIKTQICHKGKSLCVANSSVAAHLAHGDVLGTCEENAGCEGGQGLVASHDDIDAVAAKEEEAIKVRNATLDLRQNLVKNNTVSTVQSYPNPVQDVVNFKLERAQGTTVVSIYDVKGQLQSQQTMEIVRGLPVQLNILDLNEGLYTVKFQPTEGAATTSTFTVVKTK
jgi:hypothetical protein